MDARLQFEWSGEKARNCTTRILGDNELVPGAGYDDFLMRDDAEYSVTIEIKLTHKRKKRKKDVEQKIDI